MVKKVAPGWQGWLHYMYDDPPREDNFVNPHYRSHRTPVFKTDHPELSYKNQGHLLNWNRTENMEAGQARMYSEWEPPMGTEERQGKKIVMNKPVNDGRAHQEQD